MEGKKAQKEFVAAIFDDLKEMFIEKIDKGLIPSEWDGHELRQWVSDVAENQIASNLAVGRNKRLKEYKAYEYIYFQNSLYSSHENADAVVYNEKDD